MDQNLLIIDDEIEILSWLEELFLYDFQRDIGVYTANSAQSALELLNKIKFDVVLTDIHMPLMSGIQLYEKIKGNWPRCKVVFLTGYHNFDEIYQVFKDRNVRYVLKSERDQVIINAVEAAYDDIDEEIKNERLQLKQKEQLENAKVWQQRYFLQLIMTKKVTQSWIENEVASIDLPVDMKEKALLILVRFDGLVDQDESNMLEREYDNLVDLISDSLPKWFRYLAFMQDSGYIYLLFQPSIFHETNWESIRAIILASIEDIQENYREVYNRTFSVVVKGNPVLFSELFQSITHMKQNMVSYVRSKRELILYEESMDDYKDVHCGQNELLKIPALKSYLELGKYKDYFEVMKQLASEVGDKSNHDVYTLEIYYSVATMILQFINENYIYEQLAFKIGLYKLMKLDEHDGWVEAFMFLFEVSSAIFELLDDKEKSLTDRALNRVNEYIEKNLSMDLSLNKLAEIGGFNASYLSRLFKQSTKQTLTDYISNLRMKRAKSMLVDTDNKIQDISSAVGYISAQSFARAFRNHEGISPMEYRELNR